MSFVMNALARYRATAGLYNAQSSSFQGKNAQIANMNNAGNLTGSQALKSDKSFAMGQAQNNFEALAYGTELDSLEQANHKKAEGFDTFA
jgi:hypothetical protein